MKLSNNKVERVDTYKVVGVTISKDQSLNVMRAMSSPMQISNFTL